MAIVSGYTPVSPLYTNTRVPFQYRGGGLPNGQFSFELSTLIEFLAANQPGVIPATITGGSPSVNIPAGRLVDTIVILLGSGSGVVNIGTSLGGSQIFENEIYDTTSESNEFGCKHYFDTLSPIYFSGFTGTLSVKIFTR